MSYAGTILWVDLTERKIEKEPTSKYVKDYVGGLGVGTKIFWENVPPEITGTDPKNMLIFSTGPLTGTLLGNKMMVIAKSPLITNYPMQNAGMGTVLALENFQNHPESTLSTVAFVFICIITASAMAEYWRNQDEKEKNV